MSDVAVVNTGVVLKSVVVDFLTESPHLGVRWPLMGDQGLIRGKQCRIMARGHVTLHVPPLQNGLHD